MTLRVLEAKNEQSRKVRLSVYANSSNFFGGMQQMMEDA